MKPSDVLKDDENFLQQGELLLRKGSVAAFIGNIKIILNPNSALNDVKQAEKDLIELYPTLLAIGLFDVFEIKSDKIKKLVEISKQ